MNTSTCVKATILLATLAVLMLVVFKAWFPEMPFQPPFEMGYVVLVLILGLGWIMIDILLSEKFK